MDFKVILAVVIAIVVFAALIVTCTVVVYRRRKKSRGSERGKSDFKIVRVKRKCFLFSNYICMIKISFEITFLYIRKMLKESDYIMKSTCMFNFMI